MSKEYMNDADKFLDGGAEKGVVRTCRNCASYDAEVWQCNDIRSENNGYMCNPDTPGCWFHCTMADAVKVKVKVAIIREKQRLANMTATDKRIEALENENQRLRKRDAEMQAGIDRMSNILAGQSELDAKGDAAQNMRLRAENQRLRMLLSMWWRNAFDKDFWMPKCAVEQTIEAISNNNKEVTK